MNPASQTVPCLSPPVPAQAQNVPPAATLSPHSVPAAEETNIAPPPALRAKERSQSPQTESTRIRSTLISSRRRIVASQAPDGSAATQQTVSSPPLTRNLPHATGRLQTNRPFTPQSSLPALGKTASPATIRPQSADDHPPTSFRRRARTTAPRLLQDVSAVEPSPVSRPSAASLDDIVREQTAERLRREKEIERQGRIAERRKKRKAEQQRREEEAEEARRRKEAAERRRREAEAKRKEEQAAAMLRQLQEQKEAIHALMQQRPYIAPTASPTVPASRPIFIPCDSYPMSSSSSHTFETPSITPPAPIVSPPVPPPPLSYGAAQTQWTQQHQTSTQFKGGNS